MNNIRVKILNIDRQLSYRFRLYPVVKHRVLPIVLLVSLISILAYSLNDSYEFDYSSLQKIDASSVADSIYGAFDSNSKEQIQPQPKKTFDIITKYPIAPGFKQLLNDTTKEELFKMNRVEKCQKYFQQIYTQDPDWKLEELEDHYEYNNWIFDTKDRYIEDRTREYRESFANEEISNEQLHDKIIEFKKIEEWTESWENERQRSVDTESYMTNQVTNIRAFSQCYLDGTLSKEQQIKIDNFNNNITCETNELKLFKYLTRKYPTYVRWNRETLVHSLPIIENYLKDPGHHTVEIEQPPSKCFIKDLTNSLNGKGIVVSAADVHLEELSSLILVLRAIGNKLPIQIVHKGDLSEQSQVKLGKISRSMNLDLTSVPSLVKIIQKNHQVIHELDMNTIFPKQEIWFVDVTPAMNPNDTRFVTYGNKLLALFFSSFEDTVLIDTDTVPFVDINQYVLQTEEYKTKGAVFFKDRELYDHITGPERTYFDKLLPNNLDNAFFDIPLLTNLTLNNRFFGEMKKHYQESGMVAINKKKHVRSLLSINTLQMWNSATSRVHGDKELFWLGFSIAGDESYYMNKYGCGAVGELNPNSNRLLGDVDDSRRSQLTSHMLCTTHPAHLSGFDDHTLLWMNSGFITCKRQNEAEKDISHELYKNIFENVDDLKKKYESPQKISAILVPPPQERVINNELGEPSSGWDVMFGCGGYLYCAYDQIARSEDPFYQGTLVEYNETEKITFDYLGEVWVNYHKIVTH
ncbi:hypothetical protein WICMUC_000868 [Wickerhamomyces mucosus]|uniref:Alpha-1,3-mannosyltransferase n=1 Tax=Wickerhamomyces mucosus TaxID=1378264 RepID=A0A9P8TI32_9ASCO|nr:hypothetical protein WICMUC_000868 [Wickerhamomyces mucosus]